MNFLFLFFLLQVVSPQLQKAAPSPAAQDPAVTPVEKTGVAPAVLKGHVYAADTGAPIKRAQVTLHMQRRQSDPFTIVTDNLGAFEFRNVEPGSYNLSCYKTGFVSGEYGQKNPNQPPVSLTVREGQEIKDLDFRLIRGGVISGTVMDEDGEPISRVHVQALTRHFSRGQWQVTPSGGESSDDRGQYRIFNLPPGRYYVQASYGGYGPEGSSMNYAPILYPNVLNLKEAQRIEVTNGAEVPRIDFRLQAVPTYSVSGRVVDQQTGQPATEGFVNAMAIDPQVMGFRGGAGSRIRPDGTFTVRGLLPGRHRLMIMISRSNNPGSRPATKVVDVPAADVRDVTLTVGPGVTVRGRIVAEGGTVTASGTRVMLAQRTEGGVSFGGGNATVNPDLTFEVPNVQPGEYTVNVFSQSANSGPFSPGGASNTPSYVREVRVEGQDVLEKGVSIPEGGTPPELEVVLDFNGGTVSGRVLNDRDEPIASAVALISADEQRRTNDRYFRSTSSDQNGQFALRGLIPGDYLLVVWPDSEASRLQDPELFAQIQKHTTRVHVEKSATVTQDVKLTDAIKTIAQSFAP